MNLKALIEKRAALQAVLDGILSAAETEKRAVNADETTKFEATEKEIKDIDSTIAMAERARNLGKVTPAAPGVEEKQEVLEERAFLNHIKSKCDMPVETRVGEQNFNIANNGALLPTTIVNRIISTVKEMCPIYSEATMFSVKGTLKIPVYGLSNTTHDIAVGYQAEFTDITADAGQFTSVDLTGYLAGALTLIGKSVINNSDIDPVSFIITQMAYKIALFLEKELLNGTTSYATGALATTNTMNAGSISAITADNLIDLQAKVKTMFQAGAAWTMATATFTAIKKLKDGNGQYLLSPGLSAGGEFMLLGKPVHLSDNMPAIGSAAKAVLYGNYKGLAVNLRQSIEMQVLAEKYATAHAIGIVAWFEFDSKVMDNQQLATLVMSV